MDEDSQEEKPCGSMLFRHRSPTFKKEEVDALLKLVDQYKTMILNKSTSAAANHAKEKAWIKITKMFNSQGLSHERSVDCLKVKWDNLKKEARKASRNLIDGYGEYNNVTNQIVAMMNAVENTINIAGNSQISDEDVNGAENQKDTSYDIWNGDADKSSDESYDGDIENQRLLNSSIVFSPRECKLLLQCVKREKSILFTKAARIKKHKAWNRIAESYNKQSPRKRPVKLLQQKFNNMKTMARKMNIKDYLRDYKKSKKEKVVEENNDIIVKKIKSEPILDYKSNLEFENDVIHDETEVDNSPRCIDEQFAPDPLSIVLTSDIGPVNPTENLEVVKLKVDLLNYQMETAKLERKRIENEMKAAATERESKALESALRLRAARLEAVAAELKLPHSHPALVFTAEEAPAQQYLAQYHGT